MGDAADMLRRMPLERSWAVLQFWHPWLHGLPWPTPKVPCPGLLQAHLFKQRVLPEAEKEQEAAVPGSKGGEEMLQERDGVWERHEMVEGQLHPLPALSRSPS